MKIAELRNGITDRTGRFVGDVEQRFAISDGDLLFAWSGSIVVDTWKGEPALLNQHLFKVTAESDVDQDFLRYTLVSMIPTFERIVEDQRTSMGHVKIADLKRIEIRLPPMAEQRAIAGVLGALDDKIESNRRLATTAEELGRVEFESALRPTDGARWAIAWDEVELGSVLSVLETGSRPRGGVAHYTEGVPSIGAESIVKAGHFDFGKTKYVPRDFFDAMRLGKLESGDVLLYKDGGTPGNFVPHVSMTLSGFPFEEAAINEHVYRLRISPPFSQAYLYYWLSSPRMLDEMWLRGTGAAIPGLNSSNVKELPVAVPPIELLERVQPRVDLLMDVVFQRAREARTLELLRDSLLPELLSGRLRVRDAESLLEDEL